MFINILIVIVLLIIVYTLISLTAFIYCRLFYTSLRQSRKDHRPLRVCIVLGSGGHTSEILTLVRSLDLNLYRNREYIVANTDQISIERAHKFEMEMSKNTKNNFYQIHIIQRSREVKQSYVTAVLSTLLGILQCIPLVYRINADILLVNGPGTCIPVCGVQLIYNILLWRRCICVYIESLCRVTSVSLSMMLLYHLRIADWVIVQWPILVDKYKRAIYLGRL